MKLVNSFLDISGHLQIDGFRAGFSLLKERYGSFHSAQDLAKSMDFDSDKLAVPGQIHSANVLIIESHGNYPNMDGLVSKSKRIVLSIRVADCIPLFLVDGINCTMGLIHAGWRGTANGIVLEALNKFRESGSKLSNLKAVIGPSIRQCCFEIGPEVAVKFSGKFLKSGKYDRSFLDLSNALKTQLISFGLDKKSIIDIKRCTCCNQDTFYSYRRDGANTGRMIAICGWC